MTEDVIIRHHGSVGQISLNRPKALHALTHAMCDAMGDALAEWREDPGLRLVLIDHADGRGFCAGLDLDDAARLSLMSADEFLVGQEGWANAITSSRVTS